MGTIFTSRDPALQATMELGGMFAALSSMLHAPIENVNPRPVRDDRFTKWEVEDMLAQVASAANARLARARANQELAANAVDGLLHQHEKAVEELFETLCDLRASILDKENVIQQQQAEIDALRRAEPVRNLLDTTGEQISNVVPIRG
jgi:hypothetical protein